MWMTGKKILVTGSDGFIGSHLAEQLVKSGCKVTAFVQYNPFNNWGWIDTLTNDVKQNMQIISGDIRDYDNLFNAIKGQDVVFHLAALIAIPYSYQSPVSYVRTNVEGTLNVMKSCLENNIQKVIHTSTSEVYGSAQYVPIDENHPLQGQSPYSASKIGADKIVESFNASFNLPVATVRPFNTYGPRQSARAVIPTIITQCIKRRENLKLGSLSPTRDFCYVKDTVRGFISAAESDQSISKVINIGTNIEISIGELSSIITKKINNNIKIIYDKDRIRPQKSEVSRLCCDNSRAKELLNWEPVYTLEEGIDETIDWFYNNIQHYKPNIYNI